MQRGGPPDHPILLYDYDPSRSQQVPIRLLQGFCGYLQTDGYEGYAKVCAEQDLTAVGCWAHARRKFDEALKAQQLLSPEKQKKSLAAVALAKIQALYRIERDIKSLLPEERQRIRHVRSKPLLNELRDWLDQHRGFFPATLRELAIGRLPPSSIGTEYPLLGRSGSVRSVGAGVGWVRVLEPFS